MNKIPVKAAAIVAFACLLGCSTSAMAQDSPSYERLWAEVDALDGEGLARSARDKSAEIFALARNRSDQDQILKALLYRARYSAQLEEDEINTVVGDLRSEKDNLDPVASAVLASVLGEIYFQYYQSRRWLLMDRGAIPDDGEDDIEAWSAQRLIAESIQQLTQSLDNQDLLSSADLSRFEILLVGPERDRFLRPTVFDFLAHRAIQILGNTETGLHEPQSPFDFSATEFMAPAEAFARFNIQSPDTLSPTFRVIRIYQSLIQLHLGDQTPDALVSVDLERLRYVREHSAVPERNSLYVERLREMERERLDVPIGTDVSFSLASAISQEGFQYHPFGDEDLRWKLKDAHDICSAAIARFPNSVGASNCRALNLSIESRQVTAITERSVSPETISRVRLEYRNVSQVYTAVVRMSEEEARNWLSYRPDERRELEDEITRRPRVTQSSFSLRPDSDYQLHSTEVTIDAVPIGLYALLIGSSPDFSKDNHARAVVPFASSNLSVIERNLPTGQLQIRVVDRASGRPVAGARVTTFSINYEAGDRLMRQTGRSHTDSDGFVSLESDQRRPFAFTVQDAADRLVGTSQRYAYAYGDSGEVIERVSHVFTDRAIYRPGQTVFFKAILLVKEGDRHSVRNNEKTVFQLVDPNGRDVETVELTSNEFGTVHGKFTAPIGAGTGRMTIRDPHGSASIRVEEYKRPRFEVTFEDVEGEVDLGSAVEVRGEARAFSGAPVDGAEVRYRVVRRPMIRPWFFWRGEPPNWSEAEIASGSMKTGKDGEFLVSFEAKPDPQIDPSSNASFVFEILVDATDVAGETQSGRTSVTVGFTSVILEIQSPESIVVESAEPIRIAARNLEGVDIALRGRLVVGRLQPPDRLFRSRPWPRVDRPILDRDRFLTIFPLDVYDDEDDPANWPVAETIIDTAFDSSDSVAVEADAVAALRPGKYRIVTTAKDTKGREVRSERIINVVSTGQKGLPIPALDWYVPVKTTGEPGERAVLLVGTGAPESRVFVEVERRNRITERWTLDISDEQRLLEFPISEADRGNFAVHLTYVRFDRLYTHSELIRVPYTDRQLNVRLETFRDLLYPGSAEEWRIRVTGHLGEPVVAELLASMYDASLDQFVAHDWYFNPLDERTAALRWRGSEWWDQESASLQGGWNRSASYSRRRFETLNLFGLNRFLYRHRFDVMYARAPEAAKMVEQDTALMEEAEGDDGMGGQMAEEPAPAETGVDASGPVRTNFNETAFFFPDLTTNEEGETVLRFQIPEALTRWKLLALAHTPDVHFGNLTATTETRKDLMITANAPRFFREGDAMQFAASVQNLSDAILTGTARLSLFDAATMQPIDADFANTSASIDFNLERGVSQGLQWSISVPSGVDLVIYRVTARAGDHEDGEQKPLPVLTNRMMVTESLPLPMRGPGTKTFVFEKLLENRSPTLRHHSFALEYTPNPVWYAVQALPYMMEFPHECSEQIFSRLYANTIASHIVGQNPTIEQVFQRWSDLDAGALQSALEKNSELKSLVIEETPWLRAAHDEASRKRRIGVLFDFVRMATERENAVRQLIDNQYGNGAWPWFAGMQPSRYVTQHIVAGFGHLRKLGIYDPAQRSPLATALVRALDFLDRQIKEDYDSLVAAGVDLDNRHLGWIQIHYLYARSFFPEFTVAQQSQTAYEYYLGQANQFWLDNSFYARGMIALALHRIGGSDTPRKIIRSLRELALHSDELGMYWKYDTGFFWYQAPIETQALLIEAFDEIADDPQSVSDMQLWLLKQKQTQDWKTTKATTEAVYALLMRGVRLIDEAGTATIHVGDRVIRTDDESTAEAGTGYVHQSWEGNDVTPDLATIEVTKTGPGPAWGAAYWQYFEDLDRITPAETPLRIEKRLFVEEITDAGPVLRPLDETALRRGDKVVVHVIIRVDRDMEYVHLKDMRGAGLEPLNVLSGYKYRSGLGYYESTRDAATHFFIGYLPKGTYVFEYPLRANVSGDFSNGITSIQSMYAPEFASHSAGVRVEIEE
ncbi:MAG: hypothetical protein KJO98_04850 [Rhodothermia bacterium]|nr:hypothetical protein [Rhodothermia bacterium]